MRATVRVVDRGKVTIPKAIREELGIEEGDVIEVDVDRIVTEQDNE